MRWLDFNNPGSFEEINNSPSRHRARAAIASAAAAADATGRERNSPRRKASIDSTASSSPVPAGADQSEIAFLGTGSALPSKYRNVSGIWMSLSPEKKRVSTVGGGGDAGEGWGEAAASGVSTADAVRSVGDANEAADLRREKETSIGNEVSDAISSVNVGDRGSGSGIGGGGFAPRMEASVVGEGAAREDDGGIVGGRMEDGGSMLLDAGEGSLGQMWRLFGDSAHNDEGHQSREGQTGAAASAGAGAAVGGGSSNVGVQKALRDLSAVWISHPHADHHLGLVKILSERNKLLRGGGGGGVGGGRGPGHDDYPNLLLMGPSSVAMWLQVWQVLVLLLVLMCLCRRLW